MAFYVAVALSICINGICGMCYFLHGFGHTAFVLGFLFPSVLEEKYPGLREYLTHSTSYDDLV